MKKLDLLKRWIDQNEKIDFAINVIEQWGDDCGTYYYHMGLSTLEYAHGILYGEEVIKNYDKCKKSEIKKYYKTINKA